MLPDKDLDGLTSKLLGGPVPYGLLDTEWQYLAGAEIVIYVNVTTIQAFQVKATSSTSTSVNRFDINHEIKLPLQTHLQKQTKI